MSNCVGMQLNEEWVEFVIHLHQPPQGCDDCSIQQAEHSPQRPAAQLQKEALGMQLQTVHHSTAVPLLEQLVRTCCER